MTHGKAGVLKDGNKAVMLLLKTTTATGGDMNVE